MVGEDVTGGIDQKASSEWMQVNGPGAAFSGNDGISLVIGERIALRVNTGKAEPSTTYPVVKPHKRVNQTDAV